MQLSPVKEMPQDQRKQVIASHDSDLVADLNFRIRALSNYTEYMHNAQGHKKLQDFWTTIRNQEEKNITSLKALISEEVSKNCF